MIIDKIAYKYININVLQTINLCYLCLIETLKNQIMKNVIKNTKKDKTNKINLLVCGGGRKNLTLIENIRNKIY